VLKLCLFLSRNIIISDSGKDFFLSGLTDSMPVFADSSSESVEHVAGEESNVEDVYEDAFPSTKIFLSLS